MSSQLRDFYLQRINQLEERRAAVMEQLEASFGSEEELVYSKRAEILSRQIDECYSKLDELDIEKISVAKQENIKSDDVQGKSLSSSNLNSAEKTLEKCLQKIDFTKAKATAALIRQKLNKEGGAVLFFLQKTKKQMGHFCIEEVLQVLLGDQIVDGQIIGAYRRYSVDLDSAISRFDEVEFLIRLASYLNLEGSQDIMALQQQIRETICSSIDEGTTIFLEIKSLDDLLEQANFLDWFIEEFWTPLIDEVLAVSQKFKSKFIVALVANSEILNCIDPDYPATYFCDGEAYDCYKMLDLPLPDWSETDIFDWLVRFRTLSPTLKGDNDAALKRRARNIHRDSEGTPQNVCANLQELFR